VAPSRCLCRFSFPPQPPLLIRVPPSTRFRLDFYGQTLVVPCHLSISSCFPSLVHCFFFHFMFVSLLINLFRPCTVSIADPFFPHCFLRPSLASSFYSDLGTSTEFLPSKHSPSRHRLVPFYPSTLPVYPDGPFSGISTLSLPHFPPATFCSPGLFLSLPLSFYRESSPVGFSPLPSPTPFPPFLLFLSKNSLPKPYPNPF